MTMSAVTPQTPSACAHGRRLLLFVTLSLFLSNVVQRAVFALLRLGNPGTLTGLLRQFWTGRTGTDSWLPMIGSVDYFAQHPHLPIYSAPLYDTLIYPLTSLLPLWALHRLGMGDEATLHFLAVTSWLASVGILITLLCVASQQMRRLGQRLTWQMVLSVSAAVLFCYPLLKGYALGNAQTYLSFEFAILLLLWSMGQEAAGGVVAALLALVKPQFALLLLWMAVRRRWNAVIAFLVTSTALLALSVVVFGWQNNLDYLHVLAGLSRKAQAHYANQSLFGTLNRLIGNGENLGYTPRVYTPYVRWIFVTTAVAAVMLVAAVLLFPWGRLRGSVADLSAMAIVSVAASPMAWEHHYGIVCGVFVWAWFTYGCSQMKRPWLLALAAVLTMNAWLGFNRLADFHGWNLLQSYMYFGALLLVGVLMRLALAITRGDANPLL